MDFRKPLTVIRDVFLNFWDWLSNLFRLKKARSIVKKGKKREERPLTKIFLPPEDEQIGRAHV